LTLAAACAGWAASCGRDEGPPRAVAERLAAGGVAKPNVLLVTLDTTRADRLSAYGYPHAATPHLDAVARAGALFRSCTSASAFTQPSHASILTGTYPTFHGLRINGQAALAGAHETLAEQFAAGGYATGAFVGAFVLDGRWGLNQGFAHYDDRFELGKHAQIDLAGVQRPANEVVDAALEWLDGRQAGPFFAWLHLYDPHAPYEPPAPYAARYRARGLAGLYDGEIAFADAQVGRVLAWLEEKGLAGTTVVAVVGDHGEALGSHGELTHGWFVYDYAVQVPLLLRLPLGLFRGREVDQPVRTIDLYPTLLEMAGLAVPAASQGRSLVPLLDAEAAGGGDSAPAYAYSESMAPYLQYGWSPMFSLRTERWKYIDAPKPELYDLAADPGETRNVLLRERRVTRELRRALERIHAETGAGAPQSEEANLDQETLARLAALGYAGSPAAGAARVGLADRTLPDPKDKLEVYGEVSLAGDLANREEYAEAARHLQKVLALDPAVPQAKLLLATCYRETDRTAQAKGLLDEILKADPDNVQGLIAMANILSEEGRDEEVIAIAKRALAVDERNTQAHVLIGEVYMERGDHRRALPSLHRAVEIQPKLHRNRQNLAACLIGLERFGEAEGLLRAILAEHPKFPLAHFHLGLLYEEQGRLRAAQQAYLAELAHNGDHVPTRFNLGNVALRLGDFAGYRAQMEKVIELAPDRPRGYLFLARGLLAATGEVERARTLVDRGLSLADSAELKALGWFLLADIYTRKGQQARVAEALAKARFFAAQAEQGQGS
jgi:choline-sulfatase